MKDTKYSVNQLWRERFGEEPPPPPGSVPAALLGFLGRRTHRKYLARPVPAALMTVLLACARSASSKSDLQQMSILAVDDEALRQQIGGLLPAMPWIVEAPEFLIFLGDLRRNQRICEIHGRKHQNNSLDTFFNVSVDGALAMQTFILAAEAVGLGCCPISHIRNHLESVCGLLDLPEGVFPIAGLCVGYPAEEGALSMRLPAPLTLHRNRYDDSALEAALSRYDKARHQQAPLPRAKQKNPKVYPPEDNCTWSDNVSRQLSLPERDDFGRILKTRGFDLT